MTVGNTKFGVDIHVWVHFC